MFNLPEDDLLPIQFLSATFKKTSATYKYYWFLSLIQLAEEEGLKIEKNRVFARMLANAWYTVNYFKVSFGKQDKVHEAAMFFKEKKNVSIEFSRQKVWEKILSFSDSQSLGLLSHFDNQVPHWFLSPWFPQMNKQQIYNASNNLESKSLYSLSLYHVEIHPDWIKYLIKNAGVLKDFCHWNLALFLQKHNPNVPDIPNKLVKPIARKNLTKHKADFWNLYFDEVSSQNCIYSGIPITKGNYALDHFVPYNFVSHDLNWNLVPAHPSVNASKSDKLPKLNQFFDSFFEIQKRSFEFVFNQRSNSKLIEDYLTIFPSYEHFLYQEGAKTRFRETIEPLITIAHNNGFEFYG